MRSQEDVAAMQCPVCRVPLAMSDRSGIEIDYCPQCRGVWLDRGELDKIIERSVPEAPAPAVHAPPPPTRDRAGGPSPWDKDPDYGGRGYGYQDNHGYGHPDRRHGHGKPHKRRKSFLEELFD